MNYTHFIGWQHTAVWPRQLLRIVKLTTIIITLFFIQVSAATRAQISLQEKNAPLEKVIKEIKKQSGYDFFYNGYHLKNAKPVNLNLKNVSLEEALRSCFAGQELTYSIEEKTVVIKEKEKLLNQIPITLFATIDVKGKVVDETGKPLQGAVVKVKSNPAKAVLTDADGYFSLKGVEERELLLVSFLGYVQQEIVAQVDLGTIGMAVATGELAAVSVVSTGYQTIPKERATGSFEQINNSLLNRSVGINIMDRIKNLNAGIFYNNNVNSTERIIIRGRSTIFTNTAPLIVLDNFPYDGDISNINPNDIENVTILKDAAAASIWGARAGNGVIVITTKRGKGNTPSVAFNNSLTIKGRPDIEGLAIISSADYIDLEKQLFAKGNYLNEENRDKLNNGHPPFTPVIELLRAARDGTISANDANAAIEQLKSYDARKDIQKYLYRNSLLQQHSLAISGSGNKMDYYLSSGWDKNLDNLVGRGLDRISLRSQQTFRVSSAFQIDGALNFVMNNSFQGNNTGLSLKNGAGKGLYPYARLVDDNGSPVNIIQNYNAAFLKKANAAGLQYWTYNPINDIYNTKNTSKITDLIANTGLKYNIINGLSLEARYQYENQQTKGNVNYNQDSFFARNLVNQFAQVASGGSITYPIPRGAIIDLNNATLTSHQGRLQLNYHNLINEKHEITAIGGWEIKSNRVSSNANRLYGFNENSSAVQGNINYSTTFLQYDNISSSLNIPNFDRIGGTTNRYLSYYANASYTYNERYILSGSAREDASNLFGVKTNQKSVPLWSAGAAWALNKEAFYKLSWLPELKLRATYGYQGNVYDQATALATAFYDVATNTGLPMATLKNPPNERLRWEKSGMLNIGVDFGLARQIISGSIEYYNKKSKDLMGYATLDPTTGIAVVAGNTDFFGNIANMQSKGIDITLNANTPVLGKLRWNSTYTFSYNKSKVTGYSMPASPIGNDYVSVGGISPVLGAPLNPIYAFRWGGLDGANGNPQGYLNGKLSTDYASILTQTRLDSMVYKGSSEPKFFGAWRNTFSYRNLSLSFNISYRLGYYFRRPSVNYTSLFASWTGNSDYALRWQKAGDEQFTNVPSMVYPANASRDQFYTYSEALVEKADQIRLEDISLSYELNKTSWKASPFKQIKIYGYASNLGLLWRANNSGLDPDYIGYVNPGKSFALGLNLIF